MAEGYGPLGMETRVSLGVELRDRDGRQARFRVRTAADTVCMRTVRGQCLLGLHLRFGS